MEGNWKEDGRKDAILPADRTSAIQFVSPKSICARVGLFLLLGKLREGLRLAANETLGAIHRTLEGLEGIELQLGTRPTAQPRCTSWRIRAPFCQDL